MALKGVKVLEFVGLAPGPFCGKILADFGASVTRIDRSVNNSIDCLQLGKKTLVLNMKNEKSRDIIRFLAKKYDVLLEPYRPGVMEKYDLGPDRLLTENPKLIYARLTGFGQNGPLAKFAGHDINYIAVSGVLSFLGRKSEKPTAPINLLADFSGGGLLCALGICMALFERTQSGIGQVLDSSMVEGSAYVSSWLMMSHFFSQPRGENILDTGAFFYDTYETKDGKYMSVGAIEPKFYNEFIKGLGTDISQYRDNAEARKKVKDIFLSKTQDEWSKIYENLDACVFPVVEWKDAPHFEHNKVRNSFQIYNNRIIPRPSPVFSRTPADIKPLNEINNLYQDAVDILAEIGKNEEDVHKLSKEGTIFLTEDNSKL